MSITRRLRNIALSQIKVLKERLDRIDAEEESSEEVQRRLRRDAEEELLDPADRTLTRRTPEEIAAGVLRSQELARSPAAVPPQPAVSPLSVHYRVLGLEEGADLQAVEAAFSRLAARCLPARFPEGSAERKTAEEIYLRVETAYTALREQLDPTAGRFDKLEL